MIEMEDRGPLDLTRQIEEKDAQIKKLCMEIGNLEFQISDYRQIVKELSDKLSKYETLHGTVFVKGDRDSKV
jgi:chaperonin cofactor prefoldin